MFGLSISEGALYNLLARAQAPLEAAASAASAIAAAVTASDVVGSDETSVRVMKKTQWEWVFVTALCVLHIICPSRGAGVVRALFGEHCPRVWISCRWRWESAHRRRGFVLIGVQPVQRGFAAAVDAEGSVLAVAKQKSAG